MLAQVGTHTKKISGAPHRRNAHSHFILFAFFVSEDRHDGCCFSLPRVKIVSVLLAQRISTISIHLLGLCASDTKIHIHLYPFMANEGQSNWERLVIAAVRRMGSPELVDGKYAAAVWYAQKLIKKTTGWFRHKQWAKKEITQTRQMTARARESPRLLHGMK